MKENETTNKPGPGILIIENIFYNRSQIVNILKPKEYNIIETVSLTEGIFKLQTLKPAVLILGINLIKSMG
ncbi:MAG: hypothetical protein PHF84_12970, partial [bacterium]|nr:hypothetical protein [bacterium]